MQSFVIYSNASVFMLKLHEIRVILNAYVNFLLFFVILHTYIRENANKQEKI